MNRSLSDIKKKISSGFFLSFLGIGIQGIFGVITIPLFLKYLPEDQVAIWVLFLSFTNIIFIGQSGLSMESINRVNNMSSEKSSTLSNFWSINSFAYSIVGIAIVLILILIFPFYLYEILLNKELLKFGGFIWFILILSHILNLGALRYVHLLNSIKEVGYDKGIKILVVLFQIIGYLLILLKSDFNLRGIVIIYFFSSLVNYLSSKFIFSRKNINYINTNHYPFTFGDIKSFFKPVNKIVVLNISSFLVLSSNYYIIPIVSDINLLPYYGALMKACMVILTLNGTLTSLFYPFISQAFFNKNDINFRKLYFQNIKLVLFSTIFLGIGAFLIIPKIYPFWLESSTYIGNTNLLLMLLIISVYSITVVFSSILIAMNSKKFVLEGILQAVFSILLGFILGHNFGINGILFGNLIGIALPAISIIYKSMKTLRLV
jgi:O-antigen/teichoic acid export membrane protein